MSMPVISALDFTGENMVDETKWKDSPMKNFYRGKTVFITGGTGFLGQLFVEKLLRCKVKEVYVLARPKRNKSSTERIRDTFCGVLFCKLKSIDRNYMTKIKLIEGDMAKADLGISDDNRRNLIESVEIVIHSAADLRFNKPLQELCFTNVRGTKALTLLAEQMKKLIVFAYISTAYSQYYRDIIEEKFYPPSCDPDEIIGIAEHFEKTQTDELNVLTDLFIAPWANTYVFTKSLSEELVRRVVPKFPTVVVRPSIIISTYEDPIPGWSNNIYGMNGLCYGAGLGVIRVVLARKDDDLQQLICADFVTNGTLAAIWDKASETRRSTEVNNFAESNSIVHLTAPNRVKNVAFLNQMIDIFMKNPSIQSIWLPSITFTHSPIMTLFWTLLYHVIPAILFDTFLRLTNNNKRILPVYRKFQDFVDKSIYFTTKNWSFDSNNFKRIIESMSEEDEKFFKCNVFKFDLLEFSYQYMMGLKTYVAKDSLNSQEDAKRKFLKLRIASYAVSAIFYGFVACFIYLFLHLMGVSCYLKLMYNIMLKICGY